MFQIILPTMLEQLPEPVFVWFLRHQKKRGVFRFTWESRQYLLIALGMRPNPGYQLEVVKVETGREGTDVFVTERLPEKDRFYPQVVVYPYILAEVKGLVNVWMKTDQSVHPFG
jgi:hypothetical protein